MAVQFYASGFPCVAMAGQFQIALGLRSVPCLVARSAITHRPLRCRRRRLRRRRRCAPLVVLGAGRPNGDGPSLARLHLRSARRKLGSQ
eukprot:2643388-Alexandrium_andersonii.AAC.1